MAAAAASSSSGGIDGSSWFIMNSVFEYDVDAPPAVFRNKRGDLAVGAGGTADASLTVTNEMTPTETPTGSLSVDPSRMATLSLNGSAYMGVMTSATDVALLSGPSPGTSGSDAEMILLVRDGGGRSMPAGTYGVAVISTNRDLFTGTFTIDNGGALTAHALVSTGGMGADFQNGTFSVDQARGRVTFDHMSGGVDRRWEGAVAPGGRFVVMGGTDTVTYAHVPGLIVMVYKGPTARTAATTQGAWRAVAIDEDGMPDRYSFLDGAGSFSAGTTLTMDFSGLSPRKLFTGGGVVSPLEGGDITLAADGYFTADIAPTCGQLGTPPTSDVAYFYACNTANGRPAETTLYVVVR